MTPTILLLSFALLLSFTSPHFPESTEFEFSLVEEVPIPSGEEFSIPSEEQPLSGWTALDLSQATTNPQIQGVLYIGIQNATQQAVQDGSLPSGTYSLTKVNSIEQKQEVTNVQEYRFNIDVSNEQGVTQTILLEMTYNSAKGTSKVISFLIPGQGTEQELETETEELSPVEEETQVGYVPLDLSQVSTNAQIQGLIQIGVKNATEQAIQNGSLPDGVYQIAQIINVEQFLPTIDVLEYRFNVSISSGEGSPISNLTFEMTYNVPSGISQVTSYSILNNPSPKETYTQLDVSAVSADPQIQGLITMGAQNATQQAIQNSSLPKGTYQLGQIVSAAQGTLNPNDYQFNVSIQDNEGTTADISFMLIYNNVSGSAEITSYSIANLVTPATTADSSGLPEGYAPIDLSSSEGSLAYDVANNGFYSIEQMAIQSWQLPPSTDLFLIDFNSAGKKKEEGLVYYWFDINVADGYGHSARVVFTMSYNPTTESENVLFYNLYNVV